MRITQDLNHEVFSTFELPEELWSLDSIKYTPKSEISYGVELSGDFELEETVTPVLEHFAQSMKRYYLLDVSTTRQYHRDHCTIGV
jgi:hypothetical protein